MHVAIHYHMQIYHPRKNLLRKETVTMLIESNQKQPSCKKRSAALEKAMVKEDVKSKVVAKNGCDGRLMVKILITTMQVNFVPRPSGTKFT